jgi:hypothetical protein
MPIGATKVQETTTNPSNDLTITLNGRTFGHKSFNDAGLDGVAVYYLLEDLDYDAETGQWEVGTGTYDHAGPTEFDRTTVLDNSNGDTNRVTFAAGNVRLSVSLPHTGFLDATNDLSDLASAATSRTNLGLGDVATGVEGHTPTGDIDADTVDGKQAANMMQKSGGPALFAGEKTLTGLTTVGTDPASFDSVEIEGVLNADADTDSVFRFPVGVDLWALRWTPNELGSNLKCWYDCDDDGFRTIDGESRCTQLQTKSNWHTNHDISATGTDRPYLETNAQNGRDGLHFYPGTGPGDSGNNELWLSSGTWTTDTGEFTTWVACKILVAGILMDSRQSTNRISHYNSASPGNWKRQTSFNGTTTTTTPYILSEPVVLCLIHDGAKFRAISESATGHYDTSNTGGTGSSDGFTFGRDFNGSGSIEVVLYELFRLDTAEPSEANIRIGLDYLHDRWGIP